MKNHSKTSKQMYDVQIFIELPRKEVY